MLTAAGACLAVGPPCVHVQVQDGTAYIRDLPFLDKCIQNGKTPTSIKGTDLTLGHRLTRAFA